MLVNHSDAQRDRVMRISDISLAAIDKYLAAVGVVKAVRYPHDGRFARTVLADDRVDRAFVDRDRDVVIGNNAPESLCNVLQFKHLYFAIASVTLISPVPIFVLASSTFWITSGGMSSLLCSSI